MPWRQSGKNNDEEMLKHDQHVNRNHALATLDFPAMNLPTSG